MRPDATSIAKETSRILLIEDDEVFALALEAALRDHDMVVEHASSVERAFQMGIGRCYNAMLVDRQLPDGDGLDVLRRLREQGNTTPAVIMSRRSKVEDRVEGLQWGADAYLTKPCDFAVIAAQVQVLTRRMAAVPVTTLHVGDLSLDLIEQTANRADVAVPLLPREFTLLRELMRHAGSPVTRQHLWKVIWGFGFTPRTSVLEVHMSRLRKKLDHGFDRELIHTVRGIGYVIRDTKLPGVNGHTGL